jgi:hypothetical protein
MFQKWFMAGKISQGIPNNVSMEPCIAIRLAAVTKIDRALPKRRWIMIMMVKVSEKTANTIARPPPSGST